MNDWAVDKTWNNDEPSFWGPTMFFGRAFDLADGTIILPCGFCGTPEFPRRVHTCVGHQTDHDDDLFERLMGAFSEDLL